MATENDTDEIIEVNTNVKEKIPRPKKKKMTRARCRWLCCTWCLTWYIPSCCLRVSGMKTNQVRMAWREKVAICIIIFLISASLLFFIIGLGRVVCPDQNVYSVSEIATRTDIKDPWVFGYGRVYEISELIMNHDKGYKVPEYQFESLLGKDISSLFYKQQSFERYCPGLPIPDPTWDNLSKRSKPIYAHKSNDSQGVPKQYLEYMNRYARARVAWSISYIQKISSANNRLIIIGDNVYDISSYFNSRVRFLGPSVEALFSNFYGTDATKQWLQITRTDPKSPLYFQCINNLFYIGTVDDRNSLKCQISNYLLLSFTILLVSVIVCKFLAAIRCGYQGDPEQCDKFVIVLVPCYTESFESIQNTLDSILSLDYDSTRKFLFIVADGLVTGSGNDIPTPEIILQVLDLEPDSQIRSDAFESIGEGELKINRGIVYSGLFMKNGKSIPFIFVIKIGNGKEPTRPGNRGKRDSQMILMRLLSRIHYNQAMNPLERTLCNKFQQLGYNPGLFEYLLMVDADTIVNTTALTHLISSMVHDVQVMGICGETLILNDRDSWVTMIQVYEYFISHHLSKSFESMFGAVTCLPGCFCMYRIKQTQKRQSTPILISHRITSAYSESNINTLHLKNLLQLGEDRYLTTLMLKNFPRLKLRFNGMATCWTVVPDQWRVLLSQRRRWINSTVHNLFDLLSVEQLCGCCVFSMRFVILLDLFSTVVQPAGLLYIIYIIYSIVIQSDVLPVVSIVMLSAAYGLQALIFVTKRAWAQIGWMIIYVLAMPIIGFFVPLYSFWHFDDFTWGNTRQVEEEEETSFEPESVQIIYKLSLGD